AVLQLGDVADNRDDVAIPERDETELEMPAVRRAPLEIAAGRLGDKLKARTGELLGIFGSAEVAALGLKPQDIQQRQIWLDDVWRELKEVNEALVGEFQAIVGIEQRYPVAHVVQHRLHDAARLLDRLLAILQLGNVAVDSECATIHQWAVGELDVAAARREPLVAATLGI